MSIKMKEKHAREKNDQKRCQKKNKKRPGKKSFEKAGGTESKGRVKSGKTGGDNKQYLNQEARYGILEIINEGEEKANHGQKDRKR